MSVAANAPRKLRPEVQSMVTAYHKELVIGAGYLSLRSLLQRAGQAS